MKHARLFLLTLLAPLLSACFDVNQTLVATSESNAGLEVRAAVPASFITMVQQKYAGANRPFCADRDAAKRLGLEISVESFAEGESQVCVMKASGTLAAIAKAANEKAYLPKDAPSQARALDYRLDRQGPGLWRLTVTLTLPPEFIQFTGSDDMMKTAQAMMFGEVAGRGVTWAVAAGSIVDSNGIISQDGTRAEYSIALADMLAKPQPEYSFVTTFRTAP